MKKPFKIMFGIFSLLLIMFSCNNEEFETLSQQIPEEEEEEVLPEDEAEIKAPILVNDTITLNQDKFIGVKLLENDTYLPENFNVTYTSPSEGVTTVDDNGTPGVLTDDTYIYTPNPGFFGQDSFEYTVCEVGVDDNCVSAQVVITVLQVEEEIPSDLKAFPSAYGAGSNATGGRGGKVYYVTTTEDTGQAGSLRWALTQQGTRTVVFKVGGEFELTRGRLRLNGGFHDNLTVAGQTAPGDGVTITGDYLSMSKLDNVIIRYVRFRGLKNASLVNSDIITGTDCTNIIIDHCSGSWGTDEIWSFTSNDPNGFIGNITIQRSVLAEADPGHNTGTLFGVVNPDNSQNAGDFSWNSNYVYNISHRFPNVLGEGRFEIKNNVIYNWRYRLTSAYYGAEVNQQNNFYKAGPVTLAHVGGEGGDLGEALNRVGNYGTPPSIFAKGNIVPGFISDPNEDNFVMWRWFFNSDGKSRSDVVPRTLELNNEPSSLGFAIPMLSANDAYESILSDVGANKRLNADGTYSVNMDALDSDYISAALNDSGQSYRDPSEWILPSLDHPDNNNPYTDDDNDGMPNTWEIAKNLDPNDPNDGNLDTDGDGYTNLEEFLNQVDIIK